MNRITLSLVVLICFFTTACGEICRIGDDRESWLTCPESYNFSTKKFCCESNGPLRCCNSEEYSHEIEFGVIITVLITAAFLFVPTVCYISCFCCPCCPCYRRNQSRHSGLVMSMPVIATVESSPQCTVVQ